MSDQTRTIEIFTAGCPLCSDVVDRVEDLACDSGSKTGDLSIRGRPVHGDKSAA